MKTIIRLSLLGFFVSAAASAQGPEWAYQSVTEEIPAAHEWDPNLKRTVPGSSLSLTQDEIDAPFNPPNWFPDDAGPVPEIVAHGRAPDVQACARCHGFAGMGHPESSALAGLPVNYIVQQMADFKSGARKDRFWMNDFAQYTTDEEVRTAAEWFSALEPIDWVVDVVETDTIPRVYIGDGRMLFEHPDGGTESLGYRVIELPENRELATARHPYSGFIAYAPPGSVARGEALVTTGGSGKTVPCMACHGIDLKGLGDVPHIAGMSPIYAIRQLNDFKNGDRAGTLAALMKPTVANLTTEDMVDIVAYLATLDP
jgi:cytochrome c553